MTRDREVTVRRVGWFVHWEAWLRSPRGHGPVLGGTTWTKRGEVWRDTACTLARAWRIPKGLPSIGVTCWPRQPNLRAMPDCDAPAPALKGALDGLVLAGIVEDDKPPYVASVLYLPAVVAPGEPPALIVRVAAGEAR